MADEVRVITIEGVPVPKETRVPVTLPNGSLGIWAVHVEFLFAVQPEDVTPRFEGDEESDFADRAFERVRPGLNSLVGEGKPFRGFTVLPQKAYAPDDEEGERTQILRRCYA